MKYRHRKSRKARHAKHSTRRTKGHSRRRTHKRGGSAPTNYSLAGNWSSRMSLGQGNDFFKYHEGQHGGEAPLSAIGSTLPAPMRGPAHVDGTFAAYADVAGLKDQTGGRHRKGHRKTKRYSRKHSRKHRRRGGALGFAPVSAPGMLLSGPQYAQAGLNPGWKYDVAFTDAKIRDTQ